MKNFVCDKCGKDHIINEGNLESAMTLNECHTVDLGTPEYGSKFDACKVQFNLCDDCLYEIVAALTKTAQDRIFNSSDEYWTKFGDREL